MRESTNLDLLRSSAVGCVFLAHLSDQFTNYRYHYVAHQFGQLGVIMFFVHTSLVLMQSLDRNDLPGRALMWSFYIRRAFRIYPLAVVATLLTVPAMYAPINWKQLIANVYLVQNLFYLDSMWGVEWSLAIEVQMYVLLPILFLVLRKRSVGWPTALWALSIPIGMLQMLLSPRFNVIAYAPCFLAGVLAWRMLHRTPRRLSNRWWPVILFTLMGIWALFGDSSKVWNRGLFCLAIGLAVPRFNDLQSRWVVIPSKQIARYSYGIYLSHPAAIAVALKFTGPTRWIMLSVLAVLLPILAYHLIEDPLIQLGKRIAHNWAKRSLAVSYQPA
jgi:peptidoglycan/LPS O-acetylase OafA/YrhL